VPITRLVPEKGWSAVEVSPSITSGSLIYEASETRGDCGEKVESLRVISSDGGSAASALGDISEGGNALTSDTISRLS
jgi:hypothetical protein